MHSPITVAEALDARQRIQGLAVRTPLLRLDVDSPAEIYLKLENLQPIGSFKIRGAGSKLMATEPDALSNGVWTASAGNMAQGVAWCARNLGIPCTVVVPETAPEAKLTAIERLGGQIRKVTRQRFFEIFSTMTFPGLDGMFVHAFSDRHVMAGNATIGLEILEDLPDVQEIFVPFGGGGLSCGIASVIRSQSPNTRVVICEPETAAPMTASLKAGEPADIDSRPSFVDGAGGPRVYPEMFTLGQQLLSHGVAVRVEDTAAAIRLLAERLHVIAEGAGALPLAAALSESSAGKIVCVISGGNINPADVSTILSGRTPEA